MPKATPGSKTTAKKAAPAKATVATKAPSKAAAKAPARVSGKAAPTKVAAKPAKAASATKAGSAIKAGSVKEAKEAAKKVVTATKKTAATATKAPAVKAATKTVKEAATKVSTSKAVGTAKSATSKAQTKAAASVADKTKVTQAVDTKSEQQENNRAVVKKGLDKPTTKATNKQADKAPTPVAKPMSKTAIAKDPFLSSQLTLLEEARAEELERAAQLREEAEQMAADAEPGDTQFDEESGEGGTSNVEREHNLHLIGQAMAAVDDIDRAIAKMAKGTYGLCENCHKPIAKPRLEALPFAALCVDCKSGGLTRR